YVPVDAGANSTNLSGTKDAANQEVKKDISSLRYIILPNWAHDALLESSLSKPHDENSSQVPKGSRNPNPTVSSSNPLADQMKTLTVESPIPTVSSPVPTACLNDSLEPSSEAILRVANQEETPSLDNILSLTNRFEDILGVSTSSDETIGVEADVSNMETSISASPTPTLRIHKDHPKSQIIGPVDTPIQTRHKSKMVEEQSFIATIPQKTDPALFQFCLFSCFLSQVEPKKVSDALQDPSWVEAMQEELLQFKIQNFWTLVDCPKGSDPLGQNGFSRTRRMKEELLSKIRPCYLLDFRIQRIQQKYIKWKKLCMDYIRLPEPVYVDDIIFGSSNPQLCREFEALMHEKFQMSAMGELNFFLGLQVLQKEDGMFLSQDKYIGDILKKFRFSDVRSSNTPMDKENPWGKDRTGKNVELHLYRSMIGSLMYLTASRPDIMFAVCAYARHQVTPKESYSDSDYDGASQDRKSTTEGSQFLGRRLISWQCKKQTIVATSTTKAEYVAAASCCGQVLWIQN
nr:putative ribonuclease H-like domain-containing protein [Tanacetum cinerariifolium]